MNLLFVITDRKIFEVARMFGGQRRTAFALVQTRIGVVAAVAAKVARRTQADVNVLVSENLLRQFEIDALVGHARRIERIRPDGNVGNGGIRRSGSTGRRPSRPANR